VIVVTGAGDRAFSAGGDLSWIAETVADNLKEAGDIVFNMLACENPIISAINGVAVGAGLAVALMADISIMGEEAKITGRPCEDRCLRWRSRDALRPKDPLEVVWGFYFTKARSATPVVSSP
jgi:hypothetical protein